MNQGTVPYLVGRVGGHSIIAVPALWTYCPQKRPYISSAIAALEWLAIILHACYIERGDLAINLDIDRSGRAQVPRRQGSAN